MKTQADVFEAFGAFAYNVQAFEFTLANVLGQVFSAGPSHLTQSEVIELIEGNFEKTMGKMKQALQKALGEADPLVQRVEGACKNRNFLIHHYFRERLDAMEKSEGREQMVLELVEAQNLFKSIDDELVEVYRRWLVSHGVTNVAEV